MPVCLVSTNSYHPPLGGERDNTHESIYDVHSSWRHWLWRKNQEHSQMELHSRRTQGGYITSLSLLKLTSTRARALSVIDLGSFAQAKAGTAPRAHSAKPCRVN